MKTTKSIWEENTIEEPVLDEFGRQRDVIRYFDNTNENKKWYSKEEIINAIDKVLEIDDYEESMYNKLLKKELFGDEK